MNFTHTNGKDKDFIYLCSQLDSYLNKLAGGEDNRKEYVQYNMLDNIHDVIIAYDKNIPVGCASFKEYSKGTAEAKRVFVAESHRGMGISKQLMKLVEDKAKEKGYKKVVLETGRQLIPAVELYKSLGYNVIPNYGQYKNMENSICFEKTL